MNIDNKTKLQIIDFYCPFSYLLSFRDSEYIRLNPEEYIPNHSVFCPFHENTETKAAKIYPKDSHVQSERLFCFSENRLYYPHNLLLAPFREVNNKFKGIVPYTVEHVYSMIWNKLPDADKSYWLSQSDVEDNKRTSIYAKEYEQYRIGNITLFELLHKMESVDSTSII